MTAPDWSPAAALERAENYRFAPADTDGSRDAQALALADDVRRLCAENERLREMWRDMELMPLGKLLAKIAAERDRLKTERDRYLGAIKDHRKHYQNVYAHPGSADGKLWAALAEGEGNV